MLAEKLRNAGLKPGESVAMVLPNGLEFLVIFLALTRARLVAAPLNPAYKAGELRFFLEDGQARAVIADGANSAVKEAAAELDLTVWHPRAGSSGMVELAELPQVSRATADAPRPDDVALFLHTSGTTSRPKGVPLTHANVLRSSHNIAAHYALTPDDRSLVVMPLFHVHGLIGAVLSTLASGGAVIVPPRFSASEFWSLFREHRATWYSAVPTIHQVLLARDEEQRRPGRRCALYPLVLSGTGAADSGETGASVRVAGPGSIRDDRGCPPGSVESAASANPQARYRRSGRCGRDRDYRRNRPAIACRHRRRGSYPRSQPNARIPQQRRGQ